VRHPRALLYEEEERWEEAARELQRALPFDDEGAELRAHLANLFIRLGRTDDAAEQVKRSLEIAESVDGRLAAAHVAEVRHEEKAALLQYQAAATLALADQKTVASEADQGGAATDIDPDPQEFEAIERTHLALADAHLGALNMMGAYQAISTLRDVSGDSLRARIELGAMAWALGRLPECEAALQEALRLEPSELDARLMLAALLVATGRTGEAKSAFREALERSEDSVDIAEMYLKWLVARGDRTDADEEVARLTPDTIDETNFETGAAARARGRADGTGQDGRGRGAQEGSASLAGEPPRGGGAPGCQGSQGGGGAARERAARIDGLRRIPVENRRGLA
jgi:Tfp pilus assembly protein PilF